MRLSIVTKADGTPVINMIGTTDLLRAAISDRAANKDGFPGERVVRLPRALGRTRRGETSARCFHRLRAWAAGNPFWPLDNEEPRRLPIEE